jgi:hypothetical protein
MDTNTIYLVRDKTLRSLICSETKLVLIKLPPSRVVLYQRHLSIETQTINSPIIKSRSLYSILITYTSNHAILVQNSYQIDLVLTFEDTIVCEC